MKDKRITERTEKLFNQACDIIEEVLTTQIVEDKDVLQAALRAYTGHIKTTANELQRESLQFAVSKNIAVDADELRMTLKKTLPEYVNTDTKQLKEKNEI